MANGNFLSSSNRKKIIKMRNRQQICLVNKSRILYSATIKVRVMTSGVLTVWTHGGTPPAWGHYR